MEQRHTYEVPKAKRVPFVNGITDKQTPGSEHSHRICTMCDLKVPCKPSITLNGVTRDERVAQVTGTVGIINSDSCALVEPDWKIA